MILAAAFRGTISAPFFLVAAGARAVYGRWLDARWPSFTKSNTPTGAQGARKHHVQSARVEGQGYAEIEVGEVIIATAS